MDITPVAESYVSPTEYTATADPNDFDSLGNPAGQNISSSATNGNDTLYGGAGGDTINGGGGDDVIYGGSGNDSLGGGAAGDRLYGGSGRDTITGGNDNDVLIGGYGFDRLTGSGGADTFVFLSQRDTGDTITDFSQAQHDHIDLNALGLDAGTGFMGALAQPGAVGAHQFGYAYDAGTNTTTVYVDTDGVAGADLEIKLDGNINLTSSDFLFGA
jgi:Ca2+-binding RTX toxin-like protein